VEEHVADARGRRRGRKQQQRQQQQARSVGREKGKSSAAGCNCAVKLNRKALAKNSPMYVFGRYLLTVPFFFGIFF
jgi:hypothetical protein